MQNMLNLRRFIGVTKDLKRRYSQHKQKPPSGMKADAKRDAPFADNFKMTLLSHTTDQHAADEWEYHYIRHFGTQSSKGYNIAKGNFTHTKQFWYLHKRNLI